MSTLKVNNVQDLGADAVVTNGVIASGALPAGSILQVVSTVKTDTFSTTSTSFTDVTGVSATITPTSATSKIVVVLSAVIGSGLSSIIQARILRDATPVNVGDAVSGMIQANFGAFGLNTTSVGGWVTGLSASTTFLDSPATLSATTYKMQIRVNTGTGYVGRGGRNEGDGVEGRYATNLTLMEVAA